MGKKDIFAAGSIDCEAHKGDVVNRRKKKLKEKTREFSCITGEKNGQTLIGSDCHLQEGPTHVCFNPLRTQKLLGNSYNNWMTFSG